MLVLAALWCGLAMAAAPTEPLTYNQRRGEIDARIDGWPLRRLLDSLVKVTGWRVYVEPGTQHRVSTSFRGLEPREALSRLLGDLSFALMRHTNAPFQLFIYRTSMQQATELIPGALPGGGDAKDASWLEDELIVTLKKDTKESIEALAKRLGAKVIGSSDDLHAYRLKFEDADAAAAARQALTGDSNVAAVDDNYRVTRPPSGEAMAMGGPPVFDLKPTARADGSHFIVGLVDTAVQSQGTGLKDFLLPQLSMAGNYTPPTGEPTHGTSMAETILRGVGANNADGTTAVRLLPVDVYGGSETTTSFDVAQGIYAAIKGGATVINLSLSSTGDSGFLRSLVAEGDRQGILFIAAAGNQPTTAPTYPASYPEVIAVTAGDRQGNIASYANRGSFVDVIAPGGGVIQYLGQSYYGVGTSFSTALVSGTASRMGSTSTRTMAEIRQQLLQSLGRKTSP
jgi:hypothetical protein